MIGHGTVEHDASTRSRELVAEASFDDNTCNMPKHIALEGMGSHSALASTQA